MISAKEWQAYNEAVERIASGASSAVESGVLKWCDEHPGASAAEAREAAKAIMGEYAQGYDELASAFAAEWYDAQAGAAGARLQQAVTCTVYKPESADEVARYQVRKLIQGGEAEFARACGEFARNDALRSLNETIIANAGRDKKKGVRFARVPTGWETCAFCLMLAGRGAVYHTRKSAGEFRHFHRRCDCKVVPGFESDPDAELVEGFSPAASRELLGVFNEIDARDGLTRQQKDLLKRTRAAGPTFRTRADPALDYFGPAEDDDPEALARIKEDLAASGVAIVVSPRERESIAYGPACTPGSPGDMHVTEGMSLSAWMHEYKHFCQDRDRGFPSISFYIRNDDLRISMEEEAYGVEMERAKAGGYNELVEQLEALLSEEVGRVRYRYEDRQ